MALTRERRGEYVQSHSGLLPDGNLTSSTVSVTSVNLRFPLVIILSGSEGIALANIVSASMSSIACAFSGRMVMPTKLNSRTTTKLHARHDKSSRLLVVRRLPTKRPPTHPGEMLLEEFLKPLGISQSAFAVRLGISFPRLNEIIRGKRSVTPDTALRLARVLGMSADFGLGLQQDWDLWHALQSEKAAAIARLEPLRLVG